MNYGAESHISTLQDVKIFFNHLLYERNITFHPDDVFDSYVPMSVMTPNEVVVYNRLMDESFAVCDNYNADIYGIGYDITMNYLKENRK